MRPLYSIGRSSQSAIPKQRIVRSPGAASLQTMYTKTLLSSIVRNSLPILLMRVVSLILLFFASIILIHTIQWLRKLVKPAVPVNRKQVH